LSFSLMDAAQSNPGATFKRIKLDIMTGRQTLSDGWLRRGIDSSDRKTAEGRFAALAKKLSDVASNLSESYEVAMDGDVEKDQQRKELFRGLLQESLVSYAQIVLALDEMCTLMRDDWKIAADLDRPLAAIAIASNGNARVGTSDLAATPSPLARIDLLRQIDPAKHTVSGKWQMQDGVLSALSSKGASRLQLPNVPQRDYSVHVVVVPATANSEFSVGLVAARRQFQVVFDGVNGISGLD